MSELVASSVITVSGKEVIIRELSVAAVRALIQPNPIQDFLGDALFEDVRLCDLEQLTSLGPSDIEQMRPSELAKVISACKEINAVFFEMLARHIKSPARP